MRLLFEIEAEFHLCGRNSIHVVLRQLAPSLDTPGYSPDHLLGSASSWMTSVSHMVQRQRDAIEHARPECRPLAHQHSAPAAARAVLVEAFGYECSLVTRLGLMALYHARTMSMPCVLCTGMRWFCGHLLLYDNATCWKCSHAL